MDLLPPNVRAALVRFPLGSQEGRGMDAVVVVKYFFPAGRYTLYVTEAEFDGEDAQLFGYCLSPFGGDCDEWGVRLARRAPEPPCPRPHDGARHSLPDRDADGRRSAQAHRRVT